MYENPQTIVDTWMVRQTSFQPQQASSKVTLLAQYLFGILTIYILYQSVDNISSKGLLLTPRRSTRHPSKYITDLDYTYDIALTWDNLENAVSLLHSLETAANRVGLHMNWNKTEYMFVKNCEHEVVKSLNGNILDKVDDFK